MGKPQQPNRSAPGTILGGIVTLLAVAGCRCQAGPAEEADLDPVPGTPLPLIRVDIDHEDLRSLRERPPFSDELIPVRVSFGGRRYDGAGVRLRGNTTRLARDRDYRVRLSRTGGKGAGSLDLLCHRPGREFLGRLAFEAMGLPAPSGEPVSLLLGDELIPRCLQGERISRRFLERRFGDPLGELYKGVVQPLPADRERDPREARRAFRAAGGPGRAVTDLAAPMLDGGFDYRGEDPALYRFSYLPAVGGSPEGLARIIRLSEVLDRAPDAELARRLAELIDVEQWVEYFAARLALGDGEHGLHSRLGIDYFLYRSAKDGRFRLVPWDFDQVLTRTESPLHGHLVRAVGRLLRNDQVAPRYASAAVRMLEERCPPAVMDGLIDRASGLLEPGEAGRVREAFAQNAGSVLAQIPRRLSLTAKREDEGPVFLGDETWAPVCLGWDDPIHPLPRCPEADAGSDARGRLAAAFGQRFRIPAADAITSARVTVRPALLEGRERLSGATGAGPGAGCALRLEVNGEAVLEAGFSVEELLREDPLLAIVDLRPGLLRGDNTALLTLACPGGLFRRFSGQLRRRSFVPQVELRVSRDAASRGGVLLSGRADATRTRTVLVDGRDAGYVPWRASFTALREVSAPIECLTVEALDAAGVPIETLRVGLLDGSREGAEPRCPAQEGVPDLWIRY